LQTSCNEGDSISKVDSPLLVEFVEGSDRAKEQHERQHRHGNRREYARSESDWGCFTSHLKLYLDARLFCYSGLPRMHLTSLPPSA
ncbi:MAG: hypothetical protein KJZ78_02125, partial [Bryobacteraceae bacterium]|nr:hypothetical protein [Bryobacteraceae bacterium]